MGYKESDGNVREASSTGLAQSLEHSPSSSFSAAYTFTFVF